MGIGIEVASTLAVRRVQENGRPVADRDTSCIGHVASPADREIGPLNIRARIATATCRCHEVKARISGVTGNAHPRNGAKAASRSRTAATPVTDHRGLVGNHDTA